MFNVYNINMCNVYNINICNVYKINMCNVCVHESYVVPPRKETQFC